MNDNLIRIQTQNQLPQNSNNGNFKILHQASSLDLLYLANSIPKIAQATPEEVGQVYQRIFVLLGFNSSDMLGDTEIKVLLEFTYNSYGHRYSLNDIYNAFTFALSGRIQVDKELYGKRFSALYVSRFMDAYDEFRKKLMSQIPKPKTPENAGLLMQSNDASNAELFDFFVNHVKSERKLPIKFEVDICFQEAVKRGLIIRNEKSELEMKERAIAAFVQEMTVMRMSGGRRLEIEKLKDSMNKEDVMDYAIRTQYLKAYYESLI